MCLTKTLLPSSPWQDREPGGSWISAAGRVRAWIAMSPPHTLRPRPHPAWLTSSAWWRVGVGASLYTAYVILYWNIYRLFNMTVGTSQYTVYVILYWNIYRLFNMTVGTSLYTAYVILYWNIYRLFNMTVGTWQYTVYVILYWNIYRLFNMTVGTWQYTVYVILYWNIYRLFKGNILSLFINYLLNLLISSGILSSKRMK